MTTEAADVRARKVYAASKYFVLATQDAEGPWAAALAFTYLAPNDLAFFSQRNSRHGAAIAAGAPVAGVFYDSNCTFEDVESIQFSGRGMLAHDRDTIRSVLEAGRTAEAPAVTDEDVDAEYRKTDGAYYRITIEKAWVLDQRAFSENGIDAREAVDVAAMFSTDGL